MTNWLASKKAVSFTLMVGIFFLVSNYQGIIYRADPSNTEAFAFPYPVQVLLSHLDSLFFGLATAIIIFQSQKEWHKVLYCIFESIMIFLNLNRMFIQNQGFDTRFFLASYIAVFSGFTLYYLGSLAKYHAADLTMQRASETGSIQPKKQFEQELKEEEKAILDSLNSKYKDDENEKK